MYESLVAIGADTCYFLRPYLPPPRKPRLGPILARDTNDLLIEALDDPEACVLAHVSSPPSRKPGLGPILARDTDDLLIEALDDPEACVPARISSPSRKPRFGQLPLRSFAYTRISEDF